MITVIALVILVAALITGTLATLMVRKKRREGTRQTNYRTFFLLGVIWLPFSIVLMVVSLILQIPFFIGLPFFVLGNVICI